MSLRRRLIIALVLLVGLPIAGLSGLAYKVAKDERDMAAMQWRDLLEGRLQDLANGIAAQTEVLERDALRALKAATPTTGGLRAFVRSEPLAAQAFLLSADGALRFPPDDSTTSQDEREFLARTRSIWDGEAILYATPKAEMPRTPGKKSPTRQISSIQQRVSPSPSRPRRAQPGDDLLDVAQSRDSGWISWYWQEGLHLLLWRRARATAGLSGGVIGVEVDRIAALGQIIGRLPDPSNLEGRVILRNGRGDAVAQWGTFEPLTDAVAAARVPLAPPWDGWRLEYHPSPAGKAGFLAGSVRWTLGLGLGALTIGLLGIAVYLYRESDREMRDAAQRVTFVTQVSHELKTPLTNIRLYAELLERDLDEESERPRQRVATIVSEAQRLSRLISNILTFSRQRRGKLTVTPRPVALDGLVGGMVEQFQPALTAGGMQVELRLDAPEPTLANPDTIDQIVANLLSNVEKYAASGEWVEVSTRQDQSHSYVVVRDRGPGISVEHRDRIFQPFYRVSDRLSDGVTGTGIGLALSADLAQKNGGRLRLVADAAGACFELSLRRALAVDDDEGVGGGR